MMALWISNQPLIFFSKKNSGQEDEKYLPPGPKFFSVAQLLRPEESSHVTDGGRLQPERSQSFRLLKGGYTP